MANENRKDFNAMLHDSKDMPKFHIITDQKSIEKYGGSKMYFAPPIDYDNVMKKIPYGKVITIGKIREYFAKLNGADFTEPITAGIFVSIAAWASYQRSEDETPYWRTLKANGELNEKYPNGIEAQKEKLEAEGISVEVINMHTIKPLDVDLVVRSAAKTGKVVTVEEHSIIGGLGSAVAEVLAEKQPAKLLRIGVEDRFGESGPALKLLEKYELDAAGIYKKVKAFL